MSNLCNVQMIDLFFDTELFEYVAFFEAVYDITFKD